MFGSAVCEVALGLMMTYTVFGGVCSALRELLARLTSAREELLAAAVYRLLGFQPPKGKVRDAYADIGTLTTLDGVTDIAARAASIGTTGIAKLVMGHPLVRNLAKDASSAPSYLPARSFSLALLDVLVPDQMARTVQAVRDVAEKLPSKEARAVLLALIDHVGTDMDALQANIEHHFDAAMDRASGWYKRHTQIVVFVLALLVTVAANVDTLHLATALWQNPTHRQELVAHASGAQSMTVQALELQLPLGWHGWPATSGGEWLLRALGWLMSAVAITMGGSFWFELLMKFVNLRSTGPAPARTNSAKS